MTYDTDALFARLFTPPAQTPLTEDEQRVWDAVFGTPQAAALSEDQQQLYDGLFPPGSGVFGEMTIEQAADWFDLFGDDAADVPKLTDELGQQ